MKNILRTIPFLALFISSNLAFAGCPSGADAQEVYDCIVEEAVISPTIYDPSY